MVVFSVFVVGIDGKVVDAILLATEGLSNLALFCHTELNFTSRLHMENSSLYVQ